jgi:HD domain
MTQLPFALETDLEKLIAADPAWLEGIAWGKPRTGHMEGPVKYHIADVLANIDRQCPTEQDRRTLRLIALIHDTLKYRVDETRPKIGTNHHAHIARKFAERYISDLVLLDLIELHDEAYNSWRLGAHRNRWHHAEERLNNLLLRLGPALPLYVRFFHADSETESKDPAPIAWFEQFLKSKGLAAPFC